MIVAVETYMQLHSTRKTIQCLGYPGSRNTLRLWINEYKKIGKISRKTYKTRQNWSVSLKIEFAIVNSHGAFYSWC